MRTLGPASRAALIALAAAASRCPRTPVRRSRSPPRRRRRAGSISRARDLFEKLRGTDGRERFEQAAAKDPGFALAHVGLANTAPSAKEFFAALDRAVALADKASAPEQLLIICSLDAGAKGDVRPPEGLPDQAGGGPSGRRAGPQPHGRVLFGRQQWEAAVGEYVKATTINPQFSQPYNQMGYAYRFLGKYADAERTFKKYIELIPNDPNPYDSYAELLMKMGRFEDSIKNYERALALDPNFVASYVGIGNNRMFMGQPDEARKALARLAQVARNDGEKRQAFFWSAMSYVHEGATDQALAEIQKMAAVAEAGKDLAALSGDYNQMGDILLEAGRVDQAAARYKEQVATIEKANVPAEVKEATRRQHLFDEARVALARKDLGTAKQKAAAYATQVAAKKVAFEMRQQHELAGRRRPRGEAVRGGGRGAAAGEPAGPPGPLPPGAGPPGEGGSAEGEGGGQPGRRLQRALGELRLRQGQGEGDRGGHQGITFTRGARHAGPLATPPAPPHTAGVPGFPGRDERRRLLAGLSQPPEAAARFLLGCSLVRRADDGSRLAVRIVETEAYLAEDDPAAHAFRGRTRSDRAALGPARDPLRLLHLWHAPLPQRLRGPGGRGGLRARSGPRSRSRTRPRRRRVPGAGPALPSPRPRHPAQRAVPVRPPAGLYLREGRRPARVGSRRGSGIRQAAERPLRFFDADSPAVSPFRGGRDPPAAREVDSTGERARRHEARCVRQPGHPAERPGDLHRLPAEGPGGPAGWPPAWTDAVLHQGPAGGVPPQRGRRAGHGGGRAAAGRLERRAPRRAVELPFMPGAGDPPGLHRRARGGGPRLHARRRWSGWAAIPGASTPWCPWTWWSTTRSRWTCSAARTPSSATRSWSSTRNRERYEFLRWGQKAFDNFRVVPPATGIVHQVNLEYLAPVVMTRREDGRLEAFPDTLVGTDSHTTMINGLGVLGWGVGGIEAEAVDAGTAAVHGHAPGGGLPAHGRPQGGRHRHRPGAHGHPDAAQEGRGGEVRGVLRPRPLRR